MTNTNSKRAAIVDFLSHFWAYIFVAMVIVLFAIFFKLGQQDQASITSLDSNIVDSNLINYLKTPIIVTTGHPKEKISVGEYIVSYYSQDQSTVSSESKTQFQATMRQQTEAILNSRLPNIKWKLFLPSIDSTLPFTLAGESGTGDTSTVGVVKGIGQSCVTLPLQNSDQALVKLVIINDALPASTVLTHIKGTIYKEYSC